MEWTPKDWRKHAGEFPRFLAPFAAPMGRSERREGAALYIEGLLLPGERKSIEPMAERLGVDSQKLQQFIADSPWEAEEVWRVIRREFPGHLEPLLAWIVDETGWLKKGEHSVGVAHQYCGAEGKSANCQVNVQVAVTDGEASVPVAARLYLPEKWTNDPARCREAGVPPEVVFATKPQIAVDLIEEALADGVAPAPILGDAAYGGNGPFRDRVREKGLEFFLQVDAQRLIGWAKPVIVERRRTLWYVREGQSEAKPLIELWAARQDKDWQRCSWKAADGQTRHTRLGWMKVYLPGSLERGSDSLEELWLVVDWPQGDTEAYHYYLAHLHRPPQKARLLRLSRSRWNIEQYFQRAKTDLGLDHYEGRSWRGFHHHMLLAVLAYLFVTVVHLRVKKNFWCDLGTDAEPDAALAAALDRVLPLLRKEI
jgi:SRSO17 transposase